MAVPTFVAAGTIAVDVADPGSITPTPPTHQANDILVVGAMLANTGGTELTTATAGWAEIAKIIPNRQIKWWWKRAAGSGTAGPTITSDTTDIFTICYAIRGCITTGTPYEDATTSGDFATQDTTPDTAEIDTTAADRLVVGSLGVRDNTAWGTPPPPATWGLDDDSTSSAGTDVRFTFISKTVSSAATVSAVQIGILNTIEHWGCVTLGFIPPSVAGTNAQINIGDAWKSIAGVQINIGDTWKEVVGMQLNIGDTWKEVF